MDVSSVSARGKIVGRETVAIHPDDAQRRGSDGDVVRVHNARGACLAGAVLTDTLWPGVVKLSCGAWYDPVGAEDGAICAHGNAKPMIAARPQTMPGLRRRTPNWAYSSTASSPCGCLLLCSRKTSAAASPTRCSPPPGTGTCNCISTRAS